MKNIDGKFYHIAMVLLWCLLLAEAIYEAYYLPQSEIMLMLPGLLAQVLPAKFPLLETLNYSQPITFSGWLVAVIWQRRIPYADTAAVRWVNQRLGEGWLEARTREFRPIALSMWGMLLTGGVGLVRCLHLESEPLLLLFFGHILAGGLGMACAYLWCYRHKPRVY